MSHTPMIAQSKSKSPANKAGKCPFAHEPIDTAFLRAAPAR
jgi:hypothetical protein